MLTGALDLPTKTTGQVMTPIEEVFALEVSGRLDFNTLSSILDAGHSRVPVRDSRNGGVIVGVLLVKELALLNPDDELPVRAVLDSQARGKAVAAPAPSSSADTASLTTVAAAKDTQRRHQRVLKVFDDMTLDHLLEAFRMSMQHLAVVQRVVTPDEAEGGDPYYEVVGIVTLEDVIEELIQAEIVDETDVMVDNRSREKVKRDPGFSHAHAYAFSSRKNASRVSPQLLRAIVNYLSDALPQFAEDKVARVVLQKLVEQGTVVELDAPAGAEDRTHVYRRGEQSNVFTLVLQGRLEVESGLEAFSSQSGPFSVLGLAAIAGDDGESFTSDYSAWPKKQTQMLQITRRQYAAALRATSFNQLSATRGAALVAGSDNLFSQMLSRDATDGRGEEELVAARDIRPEPLGRTVSLVPSGQHDTAGQSSSGSHAKSMYVGKQPGAMRAESSFKMDRFSRSKQRRKRQQSNEGQLIRTGGVTGATEMRSMGSESEVSRGADSLLEEGEDEEESVAVEAATPAVEDVHNTLTHHESFRVVDHKFEDDADSDSHAAFGAIASGSKRGRNLTLNLGDAATRVDDEDDETAGLNGA